MTRIKGIETDKMIIFDLDDTLVKTDAKIKILNSKTQKVIKELTPEEFNSFVRKKHHVLNFDDFDSPELLKHGYLINEIFHLLKSTYAKKIPVAILTARSDSEMVREFFLNYGIDIHPELVIAINDPQFKHKGSIAERKRKAIEDLVDAGYKDLIFFDDNQDNLTLAKSLEGYKDLKIKTVKV